MEKSQREVVKYLNRAITRRQAIKAGGIAAVGLAFSKPLIETIIPKPAFADYIPTTPGCVISCVDFDSFATGTVITSQLTGLTISTKTYGSTSGLNSSVAADVETFVKNRGSFFSTSNNHPAIIFDSASPTGGDSDLGTPNSDFGGPGVGAGGESTGAGPNPVALNKILIIQEPHVPVGTSNVTTISQVPDDRVAGGRIVVTFDSVVRLDSVDILDIDDGNGFGTRVVTFDSLGDVIDNIKVPDKGNNSFQTISLSGSTMVKRLEVIFKSSGAITEFCYCV